jgi:hypothetical protein
MGDLKDRQVYFGPNAQWRRLRDRGCITKPVCFEEDVLDVQRDFVFAKQGSTIPKSKFCIAMTTGKCSKETNRDSVCTSDISKVVSQLLYPDNPDNKLCPHYQVEAPA